MKAALTVVTGGLLLAAAGVSSAGIGPAAHHGTAPALLSISTLAFGPDGTLFVADPQGAQIFAIAVPLPRTTPGTAAVRELDRSIASVLGTGAADITIGDLAIDARNGNSYVSVMRGTGNDAKPVLMRVDGAGHIEVVGTETLKYTSVALPNAPDAANRSQRTQAITDMAYQSGKLYVAGLSNEEFSSKLWSFAYPFTTSDRGTSVEIFHGNHGRLETRSPVYTFVPYTLGGTQYLIAGYLCTPLVKFPVAALSAGSKITGTTIAELGNQNRPIDMIVYQKDGKEFLLMANTARGVMKIPTATFGSQAPITTPVATGTAGIPYETIRELTGVEQMDKVDATHAALIVKSPAGERSLTLVTLP